MGIPAVVRRFITSLPNSTALVGCRAGGRPFPCCEYDVAVFGKGANNVVQVGDFTVELLYVQESHIREFTEIEIIKDTKSFSISSRLREKTREKGRKALGVFGRKALVTSLMYQQKMKDVRKPLLASMWLKAGAYQFVRGSLALAGARPMPAHELEQVRQAKLEGMTEGVQVALECIGIERATRPAIARSVKAVAELKTGDYDSRLVQSKADWLLDKSMLADCYYFLGRVACESLTSKNNAFHVRYGKLIQLALDLSADQQRLEKLQKSLSRAAKKALS